MKISIIMSVYNGEKYLSQSIESILNQTFPDFEFIIVNDGSTDGSADILRNYAVKDKRIKVINNLTNVGQTKSLNNMIQDAQSEFVARMDHDDVSLPLRLQKQLDFMEMNEEIGLIGTGYFVIDETGAVIDKKSCALAPEGIQKELIKNNLFIHSSIMMRKNILKIVGGYDDSLGDTAQDYDLYFRFMQHAKLYNLTEILHSYRIREDSISATKRKEQLRSVAKIQFQAMARQQYPFYCFIYFVRSMIIGYLLPSWMIKTIKLGKQLFRKISKMYIFVLS